MAATACLAQVVLADYAGVDSVGAAFGGVVSFLGWVWGGEGAAPSSSGGGQLHWLCVLERLLRRRLFFGVLAPPSISGVGAASLLLGVEADLAWERHHRFRVWGRPLLERGFIVVRLK